MHDGGGFASNFVGEDPGLRAVLAHAALVAPTATPVLVTGESGTGKELLALMLHEIGELPLDLQLKLLRVLETGRLRRVGGGGELGVRVRVVAMTLRDLEGEVRRRAFRGDLYYRLAGFQLTLPPLRRRRGDIPLLARSLLREIEPEVG